MTTQTSQFLIGPFPEGTRKDMKPWSLPENAWTTMLNVYQHRSRIVKKPGYSLLAQLSPDAGVTIPALPVMGLTTRELFGVDQQQLIAFDTKTAYLYTAPTFSTLPSIMPVTWSGTDYQFFWSTNYAGGFWVTNDNPGLNGYVVTNFSGAAGPPYTVMVTAAGNNFMVGDQIYFINVTGTASENNLRYGTVTIAGNPFTITASDGLGAFTDGAPTTGMALSSTRQTPGQDGVRYYTGNTWVNYNPPLTPFTALAGALMIFPYYGYLVFLNTWEGGSPSTIYNYENRARWTQIGTPYYTLPVPTFPAPQTFDPLAARDDLFGRGGANDAPTNEAIVTAGLIRNVLIVGFERSAWRLRFVGDRINPFVWERINVEYGSSCTFGSVIFDKGIIMISNRGIVISDGYDVIRIDEKIPDEIFEIRQNNDGLQRVFGFRTFRTRLLYFTYPDNTNVNGIFPEKLLIFNYETKNWSFFDDSFTCFGYFYSGVFSGKTWNDLTENWSTYGNVSWDSGTYEQGYETLMAGNQQGFVFELEQGESSNAPSLIISNIVGNLVTSTNHNLRTGDWVTLSGITGTTLLDGTSLNDRNFRVANNSFNPNTFSLSEFGSIPAPNALGSSYTYIIGYTPIVPGSVQINVGALVFTDPAANGILISTGGDSGTIVYYTGQLVLNFASPIISTPVYIRVVSYSAQQVIDPIATTGAYTGGGYIAKISNFDLQSKYFNFFPDDKRARLSKIDFYVKSTTNGAFQCNVFADSSNEPINTPLPDNPISNVVLTSITGNQVGQGDDSLFRLYADATAQTIQLQLTMNDQMMATNTINSSAFELNALIISMRKGGRLV